MRKAIYTGLNIAAVMAGLSLVIHTQITPGTQLGLSMLGGALLGWPLGTIFEHVHREH